MSVTDSTSFLDFCRPLWYNVGGREVMQMYNSFCPFINGECKTDCVFHTHGTIDEDGEKACILSLAAKSIDTYCDMRIREMEENLPNHRKR